MDSMNDALEQLDRHLSSGRQAWILGAGISRDAGIPLMGALTDHVFTLVKGDATSRELLVDLRDELPATANIEDILSQLSDYHALASRSQNETVRIADTDRWMDELTAAHSHLLDLIADVIRSGYSEDSGIEGDRNNPIVNVRGHVKFINALFGTARAGLKERRGPVRIFTTNYDTLLEDAMALARVPYWDGFIGGAIGFRSHRFGDEAPSSGYDAHLYKLHGSIDWYLGEDGDVWRVRAHDLYPEKDDKNGRVLIYPQATKYMATQRDPFAAQFDALRKSFNTVSDNVLIVCGYSLGDEHLNLELELGMAKPENKTTLIVFVSGEGELPAVLNKWRNEPWGDRVIAVNSNYLFLGKSEPVALPEGGDDWWTFQGLTRLLTDGAA